MGPPPDNVKCPPRGRVYSRHKEVRVSENGQRDVRATNRSMY